MKKLLLSLFIAAAGFTAQAQIADGSNAPDFTATDINGNTHTLSEYLAQGKTVIIDISATWCGPCWSYHGSGALEDLYMSYGPGGSDEVVVLFIEGDGATTLADIQGTGNNTQGDWTQHSPYPIIDNASIANAYQIAYFPTVFRICPEGKVYEIDPLTAAGLKTNINTNCGTLEGLASHAKATAIDVYSCEGSAVAKVQVKNYGGSAMTNAVLEVKQGNTVVGTKTYTGNVATFASATVTFDALDLDPEVEYTASISTINTVAPANQTIAQDNFNVTLAQEGSNNFDVKIYTDNYPSEISWKIRNSSNTVVAQGGPYQAGTADQWGGGGPDANTVKSHYVSLADAAAGCYTVELIDSFGDGWSLGNTQHGIEIVSDGEIVYSQFVGNFGASSTTASAFRADGTLDNKTVSVKTFAMYPNPTTGILNFSTQETVSVSVIDVTGKTVFTAANINDGDSINLSQLQKGMYIAQVKGEKTQTTEKIVIN
ncbi:hypothetical protein AM493_11315 [Flavobacterium akiainvivens]|uniref:Thioredoxin domain-containing protein n=1 Tax=Flavobacterium akiainvivens TaxID=1202724 RepID=A0A0M8MJ01_9FLAO|nr:T9SS type A sorting domain-containing protein [Flavobacterium akiainvivens]KOS06558.1 hypothetical protein AM493_11315 [Flavobacterium akiainvivens]SFQ10562.1 Por secretion system C-terminal sorting domain-containing protein [Flavobacterium akiainvivens]